MKTNLLCLEQKYESITISGGSHNSGQIHRAKLASERNNKAIKLGMDRLFINWRA